MPPKKVPIKGEPDFTKVSDERLKGYVDLIQQLIFSYNGVSDEKVKLLKEMWKEMSDEHADRVAKSAILSVEKEEEAPTDLVCHRVKLKRAKKVNLGT